jgi:hypothetical protein
VPLVGLHLVPRSASPVQFSGRKDIRKANSVSSATNPRPLTLGPNQIPPTIADVRWRRRLKWRRGLEHDLMRVGQAAPPGAALRYTSSWPFATTAKRSKRRSKACNESSPRRKPPSTNFKVWRTSHDGSCFRNVRTASSHVFVRSTGPSTQTCTNVSPQCFSVPATRDQPRQWHLRGKLQRPGNHRAARQGR